MKYKFADLVDIQRLQKLINSFYEATGIPHGIHDVDGTILSGIGWQDICTKFHRVCEQIEFKCKISDSYISEHLHEGPFIGYKCLNGLMDYATPIIVEGQHLATMCLGQLLHEPPDEGFFRRQAREYGFDETAYIEALRLVPIIPKERVESIMMFFSQQAQFLAMLGLEKKRQLEDSDKALKEREWSWRRATTVFGIGILKRAAHISARAVLRFLGTRLVRSNRAHVPGKCLSTPMISHQLRRC